MDAQEQLQAWMRHAVEAEKRAEEAERLVAALERECQQRAEQIVALDRERSRGGG